MFKQLLSPSLKKEVFKRPKTRENLANGIFSDATSSISWLNSIAITLFFTPVVSVTELFAKNSIMFIGSISVATSYLANFVYRLLQEDASLSEVLLNILGISIFITGALIFTPGIFPLTLSLSNILFLINVAATGINTYFLIRNVILPPVFKIIKSLAEKFGMKIKAQLYKRKPLTLKDDYDILSRLTEMHYGNAKLINNSTDRDTKERVGVFNNVLNMLVFYINKYNEQFLGNVRNQPEIKKLEKEIEDFTLYCKTSDVFVRVNRKKKFKENKIERLEQAKTALDEAKKECCKSPSQQTYTHFNETLRMYINNPTHIKEYDGEEKLERIKADAFKLIDQEIERQTEKRKKLEECIPCLKK